ncbi:MAG TPA: molybdate ABC transporter substrate-binding protein [Verrucomicrobiae bacterium]|nr:molybdate ABC transporter substrate-binding protein [Verrucomicrobiae bacterium]
MKIARIAAAGVRSVVAFLILVASSAAGAGVPTAPAAATASPTSVAAPVELTVYAAASLKDALQEIGPACGSEAGATILFNFGGSNDLAQQILAANKADVFFSADEGWMDKVAAKGLVDAASRRALLSNRLVIVVRADADLTIQGPGDLAGAKVKNLSIANPDAVPAGRYARAWLEKIGAWEALKDKIAPAPDVRAALAAVEAGAAEAGIVYATDAAIARKTKVAYTVPEGDGPKISYPVAVLKDRPHVEAARRLVACFGGDDARRVFVRDGFIVLDAAPSK